MTVGQLRRLLERESEGSEVVMCADRCEEVRGTVAGGEWVVVSGYFTVVRVRCEGDTVMLYAAEEI